MTRPVLGRWFLAMALGAGGLAHAGVLELGYIENPPYSFTNRFGKADGTLIKKVHRALEASGYRFVSREYPLARLVRRLREGQTHLAVGFERGAIASAARRGPQVASIPRRVYALRGSGLSIQPGALEKGTVIALRSNLDQPLESFLLNRSPENVFIAENHRDGIRMLQRQRADFLLAYDASAALAGESEGQARIRWHEMRSDPAWLYVTRKIQGDPDPLKRIEKVWKRLYGGKP